MVLQGECRGNVRGRCEQRIKHGAGACAWVVRGTGIGASQAGQEGVEHGRVGDGGACGWVVLYEGPARQVPKGGPMGSCRGEGVEHAQGHGELYFGGGQARPHRTQQQRRMLLELGGFGAQQGTGKEHRHVGWCLCW